MYREDPPSHPPPLKLWRTRATADDCSRNQVLREVLYQALRSVFVFFYFLVLREKIDLSFLKRLRKILFFYSSLFSIAAI